MPDQNGSEPRKLSPADFKRWGMETVLVAVGAGIAYLSSTVLPEFKTFFDQSDAIGYAAVVGATAVVSIVVKTFADTRPKS